MDRIEEIISSAIKLTIMVRDETPEYSDAAFDSLAKLRDLLSEGLPGHSAILRLNDFLATADRPSPTGKAH